MKKDEIEVGGTYLAKVGVRSVEVTIESENGKGGWNAKSVATGKPIRLKDPKHLKPVTTNDAGGNADSDNSAPEPAKPRKRAAGAKRAAKAPKEAKPKALSCLDAAAAV